MSLSKSVIENDITPNNIGDVQSKLHRSLEGKKSYLFMKRLIDIVGSVFGIIFLSPVELII